VKVALLASDWHRYQDIAWSWTAITQFIAENMHHL